MRGWDQKSTKKCHILFEWPIKHNKILSRSSKNGHTVSAQLRPLLKLTSFFEAADTVAKITLKNWLELKPNHHNQF